MRELRRSEVTRPTAIVWLNRTDPPDVETELAVAGANAVIPLPVDPFLWDRRLEELLSVPARRNQRFPVRLRDWSRFVSGADEDEGSVVNIGARGVLLESRARARARDEGGPRPSTSPATASPVAVVGQVVRLAGEEGGLFRVGVEFLVYRGDARERIAAFVEAEAEPDRPGRRLGAAAHRAPLRGGARVGGGAAGERDPQGAHPRLRARLHPHRRPRGARSSSSTRRRGGSSATAAPRSSGARWPTPSCPPALRDELRRRLRDFVLTGDSADLGRRREATAMRADGSLVPVEVVVVPAYVKGRVILTAYIRDLSDRRRGERLAAARQRATQALTASLSLAEAAPGRARRARPRPRLHRGAALGGGGRPARARRSPEPRRAPSAAVVAAPPADALALRTLEEEAAAWDGPAGGRRRGVAGGARSAWAARCSGCSR